MYHGLDYFVQSLLNTKAYISAAGIVDKFKKCWNISPIAHQAKHFIKQLGNIIT